MSADAAGHREGAARQSPVFPVFTRSNISAVARAPGATTRSNFRFAAWFRPSRGALSWLVPALLIALWQASAHSAGFRTA